MMPRTLINILLVVLSCATCFAQSTYKGLTPGRSTRADVERLLGKPTNQVSESLFEYAQSGSQIYVQYSKTLPTAIRIQSIYSPAVERSKVLAAEHLPKVADTRRTNKHGALEEYFGYPNYVVLTYDESSQTQVSQVGYYSRELFESVTPELAKSTSTAAATSGSSVSGSGGVDIPSLNANVTGLLLFEGGAPAVPGVQKQYSTRFSSASTRSIYWELGITFPDPGRKIDYTVEAIVYRGGALYTRWKSDLYIKEGYTNAAPYSGYGYATAGTWLAGSYLMELFVDGRKVAAASFEVY
jgi:hypothetical protein